MYELRSNEFLKIVPHALGALSSMLRYYGSAAADLPGLRPFRRGSLKQAQGNYAHVSAAIGGEDVGCGTAICDENAEFAIAVEKVRRNRRAGRTIHIFTTKMQNFRVFDE